MYTTKFLGKPKRFTFYLSGMACLIGLVTCTDGKNSEKITAQNAVTGRLGEQQQEDMIKKLGEQQQKDMIKKLEEQEQEAMIKKLEEKEVMAIKIKEEEKKAIEERLAEDKKAMEEKIKNAPMPKFTSKLTAVNIVRERSSWHENPFKMAPRTRIVCSFELRSTDQKIPRQRKFWELMFGTAKNPSITKGWKLLVLIEGPSAWDKHPSTYKTLEDLHITPVQGRIVTVHVNPRMIRRKFLNDTAHQGFKVRWGFLPEGKEWDALPKEEKKKFLKNESPLGAFEKRKVRKKRKRYMWRKIDLPSEN